MRLKVQGIVTRIYRYSQDSKRDLKLGVLYSFLNKLFDIAPELLIGVAVDLVVRKQDSLIAKVGISDPMTQLLLLGTITFLIWGCESIFQYLYSVKWKNAAQKLQHQIRINAYSHIQKLDIDWLNKKKTGDLQTVLNDDINQLERFINTGFNEIIQILSSTVLIGLIFFYLAPVLALGTTVPVPFILLAVFYFQKKIQPRYSQVREKAGHLGARIETNLTGMSIIKSFTAEKYQLEQIENDSTNYREANQKAITLSSAFIPLVRIMILMGFLFTLMLGGWMTFQDELPIGSYSALIFLTQRFLWPFTYLGQMLDNFSRAKASSLRIFELLDTPINVEKEYKKNLVNEKFEGSIHFENVNFSYEKNHPVFSNLNLTIPKNKMTALVGPTGSGKSTLIKIILRFYNINDGKILINSHELDKFSIQQIRQNISYVSQDTNLFPGTITDNIAFGIKYPDMKKIEKAAKVARADSFVSSLPDGYNTEVGERGYKLSGGQRQRITIARAVYKDAPILIFDEATSSIDNKTEILIQEALQEIAQHKTTIVIAHRLSTIRKSHLIYVFDKGKIIEQGQHQDLIKQKTHYAQLWNLQTGNNLG